MFAAVAPLWHTILASAATPSPNAFIFPLNLENPLKEIVGKLDAMVRGWTDAGKPGEYCNVMLETAFGALGARIVRVLKKRKPNQEVVETFQPTLYPRGSWYACRAGACLCPPTKVCSRVSPFSVRSFHILISLCFPQCKSVRYCSEAHQKVDWPAHRPDCFAATR